MNIDDDVLRVEVRRALELVGDAAVPHPGFDQLPVPPASQPASRRRSSMLGAAAAVVALIAGLAWAASARGPDDEAPAGPGPDRGGLPDEWVRVAPSPLSPRTDSVVAWTGASVLVAGGSGTRCPPSGALGDCSFGRWLSDGALYDPRTDSWTRITDAPAPIAGGDTATVPGTVYVLTASRPDQPGESGRVLYAYSITDDTWARITLPSDADHWGLEAIGTTVVLYSGDDEFQREADFILEPETGTWEALPDDPLPLASGRRMAWNGTDLFLVARELVDDPGTDGQPPTLLAAFDPDEKSWRRLPDAHGVGVGPLVEGDELIWVNPQFGCGDGREPCVPRGWVFDTIGQTWDTLPDLPDDGGDIAHVSGAVGEASSIVYGAGGYVFDAEQRSWAEMPALPTGDVDDGVVFQRRVHPVGADAFVFGGARYRGRDGVLLDEAWIWRTARNERWWQPELLPEGFELVDTFVNPDQVLRVHEYRRADGATLKIQHSTLPTGLPTATGQRRIGDATWQIAQSRRDDVVEWTTLFRTDGHNEWLVNGQQLDVAVLEPVVAGLEPGPEPGTNR